MSKVIYRDRWLSWTIALSIMIAIVLLGKTETASVEIDTLVLGMLSAAVV